MIENRGVTAACCYAANSIVKKSQSLTMKDRSELKQHIPKPTSQVKLPSGDIFDTRMIAGTNKHSTNNRLAHQTTNAGTASGISPGMRTNLEIDWSNQCDDYCHFIENYHDIKSVPIKIEKLSDDEIEIIEVRKPKVIEVKSTEHSTSTALNRASENDSSLVQKVAVMHTRIMKKVPNKLTKAIKDTLDCNNHDETMNVAKSLKQTVLKLEQSENDNTHINTIKSVTDDGKCIESLSSEEVLERVQLFHQLES